MGVTRAESVCGPLDRGGRERAYLSEVLGPSDEGYTYALGFVIVLCSRNGRMMELETLLRDN